MFELLEKNRSYRKFKQTPISHEDLVDIVDAGRKASCGINKQKLFYIAVESKEKVFAMQKHCKWAGLLKGKGTPKQDELPVAFIVVCNPVLETGKCDIEIGLSLDEMRIEALSKGIGSCIIGSHNPELVKKEFCLEDNLTPRIILALGYPNVISKTVDVSSEDTAYYLTEDNEYRVPKKELKMVSKFI